ncbi:hypothetical protein Har1130_18785 [Haloarcula sp. CBA1130]|uniref:hypothetical protein n=1 Tax=unclassified Haloarcula TaxID=2624677 RepID=UPI0012455254|nr:MULTISPECIES: hypothetical protein [unclassified Haloarcula]KAA9396672.1 hypothetical protein Har1130_18785 [Haloarcula sp. CBA1130]KAA9397703.1 hypothetical protein Har1129_05475 [Haloarcula sp. CBA1129]
MQRDYKLAIYALGISAVLLVASGGAVIAGASLSSSPTDNPASETDVTQLDSDHHQQLNATVTQSDNSTYTLQNAKRTCSGALRLNEPDRNSTSHQVGDVTVTVVSHHNSAGVDEIGRQRLSELVVEATGDRAGLDEYSHLEVQVNQYYESTAREEPLEIAGIHVRPADDCLPSVRGTVNTTNETVTVQTVRPDINEVSLNYTDRSGVLDQDERELIERLVVADGQTSYNVRTHLDATALEATVTEATANRHVDLELQRPDGNGSSVMLTVDLDAETVVHSWVEIQIDESNIEMADSDSWVEANETSESVAIDLNKSNITVVNDTSG